MALNNKFQGLFQSEFFRLATLALFQLKFERPNPLKISSTGFAHSL